MHITAPSVHFGSSLERSNGGVLVNSMGHVSKDLKNHSPHLLRIWRSAFAFS